MSNTKSNNTPETNEVNIQEIIQAQVEEQVKQALKNIKPPEDEKPKSSVGYSVNEVLSRRLNVKPLQENEVVSYKLINAGRLSPNITDENDNPIKSSPALQRLIGSEYIIDTGDGNKKKLIQNVVGYMPKRRDDGTTYEQEIVAPIEFSKNGFFHVTANEFGTYCFLERSNKNIDNKFRSKRARNVFAKVGTAREVEGELAKYDLKYDAIDIVRNNGLGLTELKALVKNLPDNIPGKPSLNSEIKNIKIALLKIAEKHPRAIIDASPNNRMKAKCQIMDAESARILEYDENMNWFIENSVGELELLCEVPVGKDRFDFLVDFWMKKENKASYQNMVRILKKAKTVSV